MSQRDSHETYKVAASRLHWIALILFGSLLAIVLTMYWLARPLMESVAHLPAAERPPAPRLQPDPARDRAALREREQSKLRHYGWVDRKAGIAHIPLERAMALLARQSSSPVATPKPATPDASREPAQ